MVNPSDLDQKQCDDQFSYSGSEDEEIVKIFDTQEETPVYETPGTPSLRYSLSSHATPTSILNGSNVPLRSKEFFSCDSTLDDEEDAVQGMRGNGSHVYGKNDQQAAKLGMNNSSRYSYNDEHFQMCKENGPRVQIGCGRDVDGGGDADGIEKANENVSIAKHNFPADMQQTCRDIYTPPKHPIRNPQTLKRIKQILEKLKSKTKVPECERCEKHWKAEERRAQDIQEMHVICQAKKAQRKRQSSEKLERPKQIEIPDRSNGMQKIVRPLKNLKPLGSQILERSDSLQRTKKPLQLEVPRKIEKLHKNTNSKREMKQAKSDQYPWEYIDVIRRHRTSHVTLWKSKSSINEPPPKWQVAVGDIPKGQAAQRKKCIYAEHKSIDDEWKRKKKINGEHKTLDDDDESKMNFRMTDRTPSFDFRSLMHETDMRKEQPRNTCSEDVIRTASKSHQRKCWSFTNERTREIERQNKILLEKILKPRTTIPKKAKKSKLPQPKVATYLTVSREEDQKQIDQDNHALRKRIAAIALRKPKMM